MMVAFGLLSYAGSTWFVSKALSDLHALSMYVNKLDVNTLHKRIDFAHLPPDDEIQKVATAINLMGEKIDAQVKSIKQFISYVSHEFRTPLMVMRTDAELALKSQKYQAGLEKNMKSVDTLNRLLDSLLVLTRAQSGNHLEKAEVEVSHIVTSCQQEVALQYDKQITYSCSGEAQVECHQGSLERILINLLDNAYKYCRDGDALTVTISEQGIVIADTGIGIAQDSLQHIWDPFWQSDVSKGEDHGFGLGLALVKALVELQ
ncbi:MAG: HAMP domain-containing histidine kinase [Candidatus Peribacteria bacterium]|nr:MAG: HAMP domain-containing histidine kinase [Candidatus Peribacteria bacterium]